VGRNLPVFFGKIDQDCARLEDGDAVIAIDYGGNFAVGVDGDEFWAKLVVFCDVYDVDVVGEADFF
jgi:hypothetical protein